MPPSNQSSLVVRRTHAPPKQKFIWLVVCGLLLLLIGGLISPAYLSWQQHRLRKPLIEAIEEGNTSAVHWLLWWGADPNSRGGRGRQMSISEDQEEFFAEIHYAPTVLMLACASGKPEIVHLLLYRGAEVNAKDENGATALMWAAWNGQVEAVRLLLDRGANIAAQDDMGGTALLSALIVHDPRESPHDVSAANRADTVRLLLDRGAEVRIRDQDGQTPLQLAAHCANAEAVQLLLARGAEVNVHDKYGVTPLMEAAGRGSVSCIQLLLERGAHVQPKDKYGETALTKARRIRNAEAIALLENAGAKE